MQVYNLKIYIALCIQAGARVEASSPSMASVLQTLAHKNGFLSPRRLDRRKASRVVAVGETRDEEALFGG